ncbi:MAG TPA: phenylalanine--tRNA ligase subunit beta [Planctomycetaceae bacterium]|nr:phenylalanine--tRNA ligase subunit beta [Planctomycetaceae bacterium]
MIVSKNWLAEYVPLPQSVDELTHRLTMSGLNLEEFHDVRTGLSKPDVAIDVEVTSNRPDCLGHIGVAREISVLFGQPLTVPPAEVTESGDSVLSASSISIECPDLCPEYHGRIIRGVKIGPSPTWLRDRLAAVGINSVNNVVDVTNFVMMECGQPLHAFDLDKLHGKKIIVRRAKKGETITAIDQRQYALTEDMCIIADADRPVAVAGVMGGFDTEIAETTVNVLIEAAAFASLSVRATARSLKLHSPSSYRFERKVDRQWLDWASRRCCELIMKIAGGTLLSGSIVAGQSAPAQRDAITLRFAQVPRVLGIDIPADECVVILQRLGLTCLNRDADSASFEPPSWRPDLLRECDLIEEVARVHGYDHIPMNADLPVVSTARTLRERVIDSVRLQLAASGFSEALTMSFVSEEQRQMFRPEGDIPPVAVSHSSRSHENQLRQSLIPSLLACRRQNERHVYANAELFEVARVYLHAGQGRSEQQAEPLTIGIVSGRPFVQLLGTVEALAAKLAPHAVLTTEPAANPEYAAGRGAAISLNGKHWGWLGELSRNVLDRSDLQDAVCVAELRLPLVEEIFEATRSYKPLPRFPSVSRDLNFVLPESVSWAQLSESVAKSAGDLLLETSFGGQYRGKQIDADHKSYLITCRFMAHDRTLTTEEVDAVVKQVIANCESQLSARLRA